MQAQQSSADGSQGQQVSPQRLLEMAWGFAPPLILEAAVRHHVFDVLENGPKKVDEIATATGASARGLRALLNALVGLRFLERRGDQYALAPESAAFLVSTKPAFLGGFLGHISRSIVPHWLELTEVVKTGTPSRAVNEENAGSEFFRQFVEDLFPMNYAGARALADALSAELTSRPGRVNVLDIAAGSGVWGIALAQKIPQVHVTAVDWPQVTPVTLKVAKRHGVEDRFRVINGDILEADFGTSYRVATLGHILHSEGESRSRTLLKKVHGALAPGGTIAIAEFMPDENRNGPPQPLIFAVNMLVHTERGDTYTFNEIAAWLRDTGFENPRPMPIPAPSPLMLATKPS